MDAKWTDKMRAESNCPEARPGSETAKEHGCTCSGLANNFGRGFRVGADGPVFLYNADCPLHSEPQEEEYRRRDAQD